MMKSSSTGANYFGMKQTELPVAGYRGASELRFAAI
jgi:hypothetical protein